MNIQIDQNQNYTIELTGLEVMTVQNALMEIPAKFANPLVQKIAEQISKTEETPERVNL